MRRQPIILPVGTRFRFLEVIGFDHNTGKHICKCDCGNTKQVFRTSLEAPYGPTVSCGCYRKVLLKTHGLSGSPTHLTWKRMRGRCLNPRNQDFMYYGGRGIRVCVGWSRFEAFLRDAGEKPDGCELDRIENDGHYSCGRCSECIANGWMMNVRWATHLKNSNNTRKCHMISAFGKTQTLAEWSRSSGIGGPTIRRRIKDGWTPERAVTEIPPGYYVGGIDRRPANARFVPDEIRAIRTMREGGATFEEIQESFRASHSVLRCICNRITYRDVV